MGCMLALIVFFLGIVFFSATVMRNMTTGESTVDMESIQDNYGITFDCSGTKESCNAIDDGDTGSYIITASDNGTGDTMNVKVLITSDNSKVKVFKQKNAS